MNRGNTASPLMPAANKLPVPQIHNSVKLMKDHKLHYCKITALFDALHV